MTNKIIDQAARDKIKNELQTNFLVEAGAGSGKTTSLVDRMVNLITTGPAEIQEIVAITFTRKAADELKVRFQSKLEAAWKEESDLNIKFRLSEALQNLERSFLGTVHSFCAKLLRERPIEANLDLTFKELEESEDLELLEEAWQLYLQNILDENPNQFDQINELGISIDQIFPWVKNLKEFSDVQWITETVNKPTLTSDFQSFMKLVKEAEKSIPVEEPDKGYDSLQKAILMAIQKERLMDVTKDKNIISIFELFNKSLKPTLNRWQSKEDAKFYSEKITAFLEVSIKPLLQAWKEYCHPYIVDFIQEALTVYEGLKKERSLLNFQDLLLHTSQLVKKNPEVRSYFQRKYRFLLVDEFQDTDPLQAQIMFFLTSENPGEQIWTRCRPKAGSLFIVGDPKQAIYRFRRADIDTYNRVKQLMKEHGGEILQLITNFRSVNSVTEKLNTVFEKHLPAVESLHQAAYRPLIAYHNDDGDEFTGIKRLSVPADFSKKEEVILKDAENISLTIQTLLKKGYRAKDFMVLTRYNDGVSIYAKVIEAMGIPVSISGEVVLGETREFQDLWILLKSFLDPTDEVSFVAVLRGIFFGISDQELYEWKQAKGRFSIYSDIPESLNPAIKEKFKNTLTILKLCQQRIRQLSPTAAIESIMEVVGFYPLLLKNDRNKRTYKSMLQMMENLRKQEASGNTNYKHIMDSLTKLLFEKTTVANMEEGADAVRVMNVHKAKGLEAPVVFLAHPAKQVNPVSFLSQHIKREDYSSQGYFMFTVRNGFQDREIAVPLNWETYKNEELEYLTHEELRIIYVAATRAEKAFIISSNGSNKKNPWNVLFEMENIEEVEVPEIEKVDKVSANEITFAEYQAKTVSMLAWLDQSKVKSFEHWTPTKDKDFSEVFEIEREAGGGKEWGTLIHDVFEKAVQGHDVTKYIKAALSSNNISPSKEDEVITYLSNLRTSELWDEIQTADEVLTEVPFTLKVGKNDSLYAHITRNPEDKHPFFVKGVIDLIYKQNGEWKIVDYKTDRAKNIEDYEKLQNFYRAQLSFYKQAWEEITKEKVKRESLYFLEPNRVMHY
jgi:ATP-dependent helicase/nuclease subunit A